MNIKIPIAHDLMILTLSFLALFGGWTLGILPLAVLSVLAAVAATTLTQGAIEYYQTRKFSLSKSALISGLIIGLIVQPGNFSQIVPAAVLAIGAKKTLVKDKMPVFNPAATGMFIVFLLSGGRGEVWWGNDALQAGLDALVGRSVPLLPALLGILALALGVLVSWRIRKLPITIAYLLAVMVAVVWQQGWGHLFDFLPFFSAFFMLVEPKTTPNTPPSQIAFGVLAAILIEVFLALHLPSAFMLAIMVSNGAGKLFLR